MTCVIEERRGVVPGTVRNDAKSTTRRGRLCEPRRLNNLHELLSPRRTESAMPNRRVMFLRAGGALCLLAMTTLPAFAQAPPPIPPGPLTLEQVLALAEPRSESVQIAQAGVRRAEGAQVQARSGRYPQLSAAASYDRALASEFEGVFDTNNSGPACAPFSPNPQAPVEARVAEIERAIDCGAVGGGFFGSGSGTDFSNLPFGRKNTWRASLTFSQNLYSGGRL